MRQIEFTAARVTFAFEKLSVSIPDECPSCGCDIEQDEVRVVQERFKKVSMEFELLADGCAEAACDDTEIEGLSYPTGLKLGCCGYVLVSQRVEGLP